MNLNLTQKERMLLLDQKSHEEMCVKKYNNYANEAQDTQLKEIFKSHANQEQQHLNTINDILNGQVPNVSQNKNQQGLQSSQNQQQIQNMSPADTREYNKNDETLCKDVLMTEKYVSSTYNTAIFEFKDSNLREVLNHIQKEEQQHGEAIYKYMESKGIYKTQ
ncbi:MAG: spore coat protein [Firmicutes bacterium]|nr:spore coat protein [Bacillota bacterium]